MSTQGCPTVYHLSGVLIHVGPEASQGHYIARIKEQETGLEETVGRMTELDNSLTSTEQAILQGQYSLTTLRQEADRLHSQAADIKDRATELQEVTSFPPFLSIVI